MDRFRRWVLLIVVVLAALSAFYFWSDIEFRRDAISAGRAEEVATTPATGPFIMTMGFLVACGLLVFFLAMDRFAQGSVAVVAIIQFFFFQGWLLAFDRTDWQFGQATIFSVILLGFVALTFWLQRERRREPAKS